MAFYGVNLFSLWFIVIVIVGHKLSTVLTVEIVTDNSTTSDDPQEIQKAVCTVTAGEVRASAEAITTKTLQGVCGSAEMNLAVHNLEIKLHKELQEIKEMLKKIASQNCHNDAIKLNTRHNQELSPTKSWFNIQEATTSLPQLTEDSTSQFRKIKPQLKFLPSKHNAPKEKSFSYYWKVENFTEHVNGSSDKVESPMFSIKGKPLRIKASFNYLGRDFLYLRLDYATFETQDKFKNNIVLDTGGIFKHIEDKSYFKHKISILDQNNGSNDIESQEFLTLNTGFSIPLSALLSPMYSKNNCLLIQISLYL